MAHRLTYFVIIIVKSSLSSAYSQSKLLKLCHKYYNDSPLFFAFAKKKALAKLSISAVCKSILFKIVLLRKCFHLACLDLLCAEP